MINLGRLATVPFWRLENLFVLLVVASSPRITHPKLFAGVLIQFSTSDFIPVELQV
jgi:hypothetical protein